VSGATRRTRARAMGTALLLLATGAVLGIGVDRLWLSPTHAEGMSLTPAAMSERLGLTSEEEARLSVLLDSLHDVMTAAAAEGPDALRAATASAHRRIEASLRPESRPAFHGWMQEHREHMMRRMHPGPMSRGMMHRVPPMRPDADDQVGPPSGSR
jgi:hypothetical protein